MRQVENGVYTVNFTHSKNIEKIPFLKPKKTKTSKRLRTTIEFSWPKNKDKTAFTATLSDTEDRNYSWKYTLPEGKHITKDQAQNFLKLFETDDKKMNEIYSKLHPTMQYKLYQDNIFSPSYLTLAKIYPKTSGLLLAGLLVSGGAISWTVWKHLKNRNRKN